MPRMTRIRITGCKYDGFRKYHENSIYDLTRDGEPDHVLFTLKNQGGKGVFMQLISQIVLPETRWGKQSGNKITSMFYDHKNRFRPYTFHVLVEWKLDTTPEKWLITGICITAVKRNYSDEEDTEERAGLNYFLYTHEHDGKDFFSLENIPVYEPQTRKVVEYDEFEQFINEYQRYFIKYSKSSVRRLDSDYYNYLKSRGIHRSEWEILKLINKHEGGVGNYFSRAADNKAVFDRFIIPAISQNMKNYSEGEQDSLKGIFKSNLSITKNLPVLIEREQDYRNLLSYIEPLVQLTEIGLRRQRILNNSIEEGNNLYAGLNNRLSAIEKDILTWRQEKERTLVQIRQLEYEKDNLEYAREHVNLKRLDIRKLELDASVTALETEVEQLEILKKRCDISRLLLKIKDLEDKIQVKLREREQLIKDLNLKDVEEKMASLEKSIRDKWENTRERWTQISKDHFLYMAHLDGKLNKLHSQKKKEDRAADTMRAKIIKFEDDQEELEKHREKLSVVFDPLRMALPEMLLEELAIQDVEEKADIDKLEEKINGIAISINDSKIEQMVKEKDIEYKQSEIDKLKGQFNIAKDEEDSLKMRICNELNLHVRDEIYRENWVNNRSYDLEKLVKEKKIRLDQLKQNLWENNIDKSLNQENYWVPNKDVVSIKDKIKCLGVQAQLGTEFLSHLEQDEKSRLILEYPSIIYGIVIGGIGDWELLKDNLEEEVFLRSSVPIYIRSEMQGKESCAFQIIVGDELQLVLNPSKYMQWKNNVIYNDRQISEGINILSDKIDDLERLTKDIQSQMDEESSAVILERLRDKQDELDKLKLGRDKLKKTIGELEESLKKTTHRLETVKKQNENTKQNISKLNQFIENLQKLEAKEKEIGQVKETLKSIDDTRTCIEEEINDNRRLKDGDVQNFEVWKMKARDKLSDIRAIISDARFVEAQIESETTGGIEQPEYVLIDEDFALDISSWDNLSKNIEDRNYQIGLINKDINYIEQGLAESEDDLKKIDKQWGKHEPIEGNKESLSLKRESVEKELQKAGEELKRVSMERIAVVTKIDETKKRSVKIENKIKEEYGKAALMWDGLNLDEKEYLIKKGLKENKEYLNETEVVIAAREKDKSDIKDIISDIKIYQELDFNKGKISEGLMAKIRENSRQELELWKNKFEMAKDQLILHRQQAGKRLDEFIAQVKDKIRDDILKNRILNSLQETKIDRYDSNLDSFNSMKQHFQKEINSISSDKAKAEEIRNTWAERASRHAITMVESLKEMISGMNYVNENGYVFPLLKLRGEELLPGEEDDIFYTLRDYFVESIGAIIKEYDDIENVDDEKIEKMMGDQAIFSRAVMGRYPILMVYKMTEKNEFRYAKPHDHYYTTWEAINKGEGDLPEGSGGQTLSISTFVIMMLMNYKKRYVGNDNPWTVLMLDNPFGSASGSHVLDPIFEIANKLNFQIIAFAAPEIVKAEISERFPVFWALNIGDEEEGKSGVVTGRVVHGGRINKVVLSG